MRSIFLVLAAVAHAQDADEATMLQMKSAKVRKHTNGKATLTSLRKVASSLAQGGKVKMGRDEVDDTLETARQALEDISPTIYAQVSQAQTQINHAAAAVQACHVASGVQQRADLAAQSSQKAADLQSCQGTWAQLNQAAIAQCNIAQDCLCDEANVRRDDQAALCVAKREVYELAYCEHNMACVDHGSCHETEYAVYVALQNDVESEMETVTLEYITVQQSTCLMGLIQTAIATGTPIDVAATVACNTVDTTGLTIVYPTLPAEPAACPAPTISQTYDGTPWSPQCVGIQPVDGCTPLLINYQLSNLQNSPAQPALSTGYFTSIKAVYKSGRIMCDRNRNSANMWQTCCNSGYSSGCGASFELIHNGNVIIQQPNWHTSAAQCAQPTSATGDVVCEQAIEVAAGDNFIATWSETRRQASLGDNEVDLVVDLFGCNA